MTLWELPVAMSQAGRENASTLARDVFSVVRRSRMWCPHDIGRDSWVWAEQDTLEMMNSPHEVGDEPLTEGSTLSGGNGVARG